MAINPRNDFRVYRSCPEIRPQIYRTYGWAMLRLIVSFPFFIIMMPLSILSLIFATLDRVTGNLALWFATAGDRMAAVFYAREMAAIHEAHEVLPLEEIQARTPSLVLYEPRRAWDDGEDE